MLSHRALVHAKPDSNLADAEPESFAQPPSLRPLLLGEPRSRHVGWVLVRLGGDGREPRVARERLQQVRPGCRERRAVQVTRQVAA